MSLSNGLKNAGKYKDLIILLDESTSIKVSEWSVNRIHRIESNRIGRDFEEQTCAKVTLFVISRNNVARLLIYVWLGMNRG